MAMKTELFDLLDYLSRTGAEMNAMSIVKEDREYATLKESFDIVGEKRNEIVKKGMYLYSNEFDNDAELFNMADEIYNHNSENVFILYFSIP